MSKENVEIMKRCDEMWTKGDIAGSLAMHHPEIVVYEPPSLPYGGAHHGVDGLQNMMKKIGECWEITGTVEREIFDGGDDIVFKWMKMPARSRKTGKEIELEALEKIRIKDGKIFESRIFYLDTHAALKALGL